MEDENLKGLLTLLITVSNLKEEKESRAGAGFHFGLERAGHQETTRAPPPKKAETNTIM